MSFSNLELAALDRFFSNLPSVKAREARAKADDDRHRRAYLKRTTPQQQIDDEIRGEANRMAYNFWLRIGKHTGTVPAWATYL